MNIMESTLNCLKSEIKDQNLEIISEKIVGGTDIIKFSSEKSVGICYSIGDNIYNFYFLGSVGSFTAKGLPKNEEQKPDEKTAEPDEKNETAEVKAEASEVKAEKPNEEAKEPEKEEHSQAEEVKEEKFSKHDLSPFDLVNNVIAFDGENLIAFPTKKPVDGYNKGSLTMIIKGIMNKNANYIIIHPDLNN
jgi:hypothetical protein